MLGPMTVLGRDTSERLRDCAAVQGFVERVCFKTGPPGLVGAELEWLVAYVDYPTDPVPIPLLRTLIDAAGPPPRGSSVTYEPGGQLELSSPAFRGPTACWQALTEDAEHVRRALAPAGAGPAPHRDRPVPAPPPPAAQPALRRDGRLLRAAGSQRRDGPGDDVQHRRRAGQPRHRRRRRRGAAALAAAARRSARCWSRRSPTPRCTPGRTPAGSPPGSGSGSGSTPSAPRCRRRADPATAWADYALDARLMLRAATATTGRPRPALTFREWVDGRTTPPTADDLAFHLTTLFPPVRPRGWFEVRYIDAQPWRWWPVPMAVLTALLEDPVAGPRPPRTPAPGSTLGGGRPRRADRPRPAGRRRRLLRRRADARWRAAASTPTWSRLVAAFRDRYVARGRCPADDLLEVR